MSGNASVTIRHATSADKDAVGHLAHRLLSDIDAPRFDPQGYAAIAGELLASDSGFIAYLAVTGEGDEGDGAEKVVGLITLAETCALFSGGHFGELQEFFIDPAYRSGGLGQRMLRFAVEEGKRRNWQRLQVNAPAPEKSQRSYDFYKKAGFEDIGPLMRYFLDKDGLDTAGLDKAGA
jgi:GNAT superfamily N-acetyltransferase